MFVSSKILHENKSQGVLYEFKQGARVWHERQKRFLCVGGELDGQMMTRWDISQSKYPTFYQPYNRTHYKQPHKMIWVYMQDV